VAAAPLPPDAAPPFPVDAVAVARVLGAWGIKGWIRVQPYSKDPQALFSSRQWYLQADSVGASAPLPPMLRVTQAREQGDHVVAALRDFDDRDRAESLRGARIFVPRSSFPTPEDDEHYWVDLIGLRVINRDAVMLGTVVALLDTGVHSVLRVQPEPATAAEVLIPFVSAHVDRVDKGAGEIVVDWGLDY
jgi:16S rRNA processing protein RimM